MNATREEQEAGSLAERLVFTDLTNQSFNQGVSIRYVRDLLTNEGVTDRDTLNRFEKVHGDILAVPLDGRGIFIEVITQTKRSNSYSIGTSKYNHFEGHYYCFVSFDGERKFVPIHYVHGILSVQSEPRDSNHSGEGYYLFTPPPEGSDCIVGVDNFVKKILTRGN